MGTRNLRGFSIGELMDLDRKIFIEGVSSISERLQESKRGGFPLCLEILDYFRLTALYHFRDTMERLYWPNFGTIETQLYFDGKFEGLDESERDTLRLETRLKCLNEWKEIVLKDELYREF